MPSHEDYNADNSQGEHTLIADEFLGLVGILIICFSLAHLLERVRSKCPMLAYMNETNVAIGVGTITGILLRMVPDDIEIAFEPEILYYILLPPIIFDAGYSLKKKHFFQNFGSILMFAIVGTFVSAFCTAGILFCLAKLGWIHHLDTKKGFFEPLLFGSMISAVDPVTTMAVIQAQAGFARDQTLPSLMFGESVLNDAVAIVLFRSVSLYKDENFFTPRHLLGAVGIFMVVFFVSMLIGVSFALLISFGFRRADLAHHSSPMLEVVLVVLFLFSSYMLAEACSMSGIVSLFFFGVAVSHYNWSNHSIAAQTTTAHGFKSVAALAETVLYLYLGLTMSSGIDKWDASLVVFGLLSILIARAFAIFPLSAVINSFRYNPIPAKYQVVLWYAGLRGAIAFGLALDFPTDNRPYIVSTTIFIVLFTTVVFGSATSPLLRVLDIEKVAADQEALVEAAMRREIMGRQTTRLGRFWQRLIDFEMHYMRPFFSVAAYRLEQQQVTHTFSRPYRGISTINFSEDSPLTPRDELDADVSRRAFVSLQLAMKDGSSSGDGATKSAPSSSAPTPANAEETQQPKVDTS